jgi:hypothetical protein
MRCEVAQSTQPPYVKRFRVILVVSFCLFVSAYRAWFLFYLPGSYSELKSLSSSFFDSVNWMLASKASSLCVRFFNVFALSVQFEIVRVTAILGVFILFTCSAQSLA